MENKDTNLQNPINLQGPVPTPVAATPASLPGVANEPPQIKDKKGVNKVLVSAIVVVLVALVVAVGGFWVYYKSGLFGQNSLNAQPASSMTFSANPSPPISPTPTPVVVNNQQDVQNALNAVNGVDPNSMTSTLNQNASDAAAFGQ